MWPRLAVLRRPNARSIRWRLLSQIGAVFALGMLALYWAASSYARLAADSSYDRVLSGSAASIAETLSITPEEVRVDLPYAAMDMLAAAPDDRVFYRVIDTRGKTVTGYPDLPDGDFRVDRRSLNKPVNYFDADYRGESLRFVVLGREARWGGQNGWVWVQVGQTRGARSALANSLTVRALLPIGFMTVVAMIVIWISIGRALRPLERIGDSLTARDPSDLSAIGTAVPREIAPLILAINGFMGRLDTSFSFLRTFIATTAHQLRTPLTALLVQLRLAQTARGAGRNKAIASAEQSAKRLARLLEQLLSDALVEHRSGLQQHGTFDLKRLVEQAIRETVQLSHDSDVRFTAAMATAKLRGDQVMLAEAVKNLIHNAMTHGHGAEGEVEIMLEQAEGGYRLTVADRGAGLAEALLPELADRFTTGSPASQGAGLGLSIVKQVIDRHGGSFALTNRADGGACARVWLPA
jgi:two-component system, OmpR family, sensor histidine kinase TctE